MPEISVIVPVYNVEKYLKRCINSILAQSFTDFELILIDDGSPDSCPQICDEYAQKDSRIKVIHKKNGGVAIARNTGIDIATGEYLTFVDSDDWIHSEFLEHLLNIIVNNDADLSVCSFQRPSNTDVSVFFDSNTTVYTDPEKFWCTYRSGAPWAFLFKKSIWNEIRFPVGKDCEDLYTIYKYIFRCKKIVYSYAELYCYYYNPESVSNNWSVRLLDNLDAIEEQMQFFIKNGYNAALLKYCASYLYNITWHLEQIKLQNDDAYKKYETALKKRGKEALIKYKEYIKKVPGWEYYYYQFFPFEMKIRNYCIQAKKKLFGKKS